jgi:CoA:oxalate CoA-transferase
VVDIVTEWTRALGREEIFQTLIAAKVPCAPVRELEEVVQDKNMHARGSLQYQNHPELGQIIVQQTPIRFHGLEPMEIEPSHRLGADTAEMLLRHTDLDRSEVEALVPGTFSDAAPI